MRNYIKLKTIFILLFFLFSLHSAISKETTKNILYVGGSGEGNFTSINDALMEAKDGCTIFVYKGIYEENLTINKRIRLVGEEKETTVIDGRKEGNVIHVTANGVSIEGFTIRNSSYVLEEKEPEDRQGAKVPSGGITKVNKTTILERNLTTAGILVEANHVNISDCIIEDCQLGIVLRKAENCSVANCKINAKKLPKTIGLGIYGSKAVRIHDCNISFCSIGLDAMWIEFLEISRNNLFSNLYAGMSLQISSNCTVHHNTIYGSKTGAGVRGECKNVLFYDNNFIGNEIPAVDYCNATWDNGVVGNYWDDYNGTDADGDGIGDKPYVISGLMIARDYHPLMEKVNLTSPISITISYPEEGSTVFGVIKVKGYATCKEGIKEVSVRIDNGSWIRANGTSEWSIEIDVSKYDHGRHTLEARAISNDNNFASTKIDFWVKKKSSIPSSGLMICILAILFITLLLRKKRR